MPFSAWKLELRICEGRKATPRVSVLPRRCFPEPPLLLPGSGSCRRGIAVAQIWLGLCVQGSQREMGQKISLIPPRLGNIRRAGRVPRAPARSFLQNLALPGVRGGEEQFPVVRH